jgi:hypothetical protein
VAARFQTSNELGLDAAFFVPPAQTFLSAAIWPQSKPCSAFKAPVRICVRRSEWARHIGGVRPLRKYEEKRGEQNHGAKGILYVRPTSPFFASRANTSFELDIGSGAGFAQRAPW